MTKTYDNVEEAFAAYKGICCDRYATIGPATTMAKLVDFYQLTPGRNDISPKIVTLKQLNLMIEAFSAGWSDGFEESQTAMREDELRYNVVNEA